ncbi:MAG: YggS family pyridoxal phosphate-dependent enzyme [Bacillota bacterium]
MQERINEIFAKVNKITSSAEYKYNENVIVMGASKTQPPEKITLAKEMGITHFGENRMQEWRDKKHLPFKFDFIGALQANKLKYLVGEVETIQSISSEKLLLECDKIAGKKGVKQNILLEVNIGGEIQKSGISETEVQEITNLAFSLENINMQGYMTVLPKLENQNGENLYLKMREIYENQKEIHPEIKTLSMGMSDDFEDAIKYGSNMIRIGTLLFGGR